MGRRVDQRHSGHLATVHPARFLTFVTAPYELVEWSEPASTFHARIVPEGIGAQIWRNTIPAPAIVVGSTQDVASTVDEVACAAAGVEVVRRRSGGGAVLLVPGEVEWIDVLITPGAPGWASDVHAPMIWLGEQLAAVIRELTACGPDDVSINRAGMIRSPWSALVCFDGLGPGEVSVDGRKLIGLSQRRTRSVARLQCCWYSTYDADRIAGLLAAAVRPGPGQLRPIATLDRATADAIPAALAERIRDADGRNREARWTVGGESGSDGDKMGRNG
jgi:lipoate-protein ligase A